MQAQAAQQTFLESMGAMLQDELDRRHSRLLDRRYKRSGLGEKVTLADFDWRFNPKLPRAACFELHTLKFVLTGSFLPGAPFTRCTNASCTGGQCPRDNPRFMQY